MTLFELQIFLWNNTQRQTSKFKFNTIFSSLQTECYLCCVLIFIFHFLIANTCTATNIQVTNAESVSPTVDSTTGTAYAVTCSSGYTINGNSNGDLVCDGSGNWITTKPGCDGKRIVEFAKPLFTY